MILTRHDPLAHQLLPCASLLELQLQHCTTAERGKRRKPISARNIRGHIFKRIFFSPLDAKAVASSRMRRPPSHPTPLQHAIAEVAVSGEVSVFCCGQQGEEVAKGLGRVIKIRKAGPVSQFFLQLQVISSH